MALSRVPGDVRPVGALDHEHRRIADLRSKSLLELRDMLRRQEHMLKNEKLINSLKDKGEKIRSRRDELENLIKEKTKEVDDAASLLAQLTIGGQKTTVEEMEFKFGAPKYLPNNTIPHAKVALDSDDSDDEETPIPETRPMREQSTRGTNASHNPSKESDSREADVKDEFSKEDSTTLHIEKHALSLADKAEHLPKPRQRFIPSHTSSDASKSEQVASKSGLVRREQQAKLRPSQLMPLEEENRLSKTKMLSLKESIDLEWKHRLSEGKVGSVDNEAARVHAQSSTDNVGEEDHGGDTEDEKFDEDTN